MWKTAKTMAVPAGLALAGVKASELFGFSKPWQQVGAGFVGAVVGLVIAAQFGGKSAAA